MSTVFGTLNGINVNEHTEKKNGLTYLSWAWAWAEFCKAYPDTTYEIVKFDGKPYYSDDSGAMCYTKVTANNITHEMWLPVMDGANKAMKTEPYTYKIKEYKNNKWTGDYIDKTVDAYTMFDINKTIMRCLTKNLAMFGLGLYIYAGEDLPDIAPELIDEDKVNDIINLVLESKSDSNKFLSYMKVNSIEEMTIDQYNKAKAMLKSKIEKAS